jgi:hypothetical protein
MIVVAVLRISMINAALLIRISENVERVVGVREDEF